MSERNEYHRPVLVRTMDRETGLAIEAMVAAGIFRSVSDGVAILVQEGLSLRLSGSPELQEKIDILKRMKELAKT